MSKANGSKRLVSLDSIGVDVELEEQGQWYPLDGICEGIEVKLRSPHCDDFLRLQSSLQQRSKVFNVSGEADLVAIEKIHRRCIGENLLIDWRGLAGEDGKPLPFARELAIDIMRKQRHRRLSQKIAMVVRRITNDEEVERTAEGKESVSASDTTSLSAS